MTLLQVRAGGSGKEQVEAGLDLVAAAAGAAVEVTAAKRDSAAGGKGRELPPS